MLSPLDGLLRLRGVTWDWREGGVGAGVIAQEVEAVFPELVITIDGIKHVNYGGVVGVLVEAVKILAARVADLEKR